MITKSIPRLIICEDYTSTKVSKYVYNYINFLEKKKFLGSIRFLPDRSIPLTSTHTFFTHLIVHTFTGRRFRYEKIKKNGDTDEPKESKSGIDELFRIRRRLHVEFLVKETVRRGPIIGYRE